MSVNVKTYYGTPGTHWIQDSVLAFVKVLKVARSGLVYSETSDAPEGLEFKYTSSGGKIEFDSSNPFTGPEPPGRPNRFNLERIHVKYKA